MTCPHCKAPNESGAEICFTCGRAMQALIQGAIVSNRYEVQSLLGRGGMGAVYKAFDRVLEETVALKVLRTDFADDEGLQKRFLQEIKLARKISHRNVCRIHEYGDDNGLRYISMAYVEGVDLKKLLRDGPLPTEEAFDAMVQVAEGLAAIHDEHVVHRDLKTPNILRDIKGVVRLLDFGIAKEWQAPSEAGLTGTGLLIGTPEYMSPEQVLGRKLDARSDLYSLGVVIFEVFTNQLPFQAESRLSLLQKHVSQQPPLQGPEAARLPRPLIPVLRRVLAKEPPLRHASALELADSLREAWEATRSTGAGRRRDAEDEIATAPGGGAGGGTQTGRLPATAPAPATGVGGSVTRTSITDPGRRTRGPRPVTAPRLERPSIDVDADEPRGMPWGWIAAGVVALALVIVMVRSRTAPKPRVTEPAAVASATEAPTLVPTGVSTAAPMPMFPQDTLAPAPPAVPTAEAAAPPPLDAAEEPGDEASGYRQDCSRGVMQACYSLGEAHRQGQGVRQDIDRAVSLFERACERNHAKSCEALGLMALHGQGVTRDPQRAVAYFKRGCSAGDTNSCRMVDEIAERESGRERGGPPGGGRGGPGGPPGGGPR